MPDEDYSLEDYDQDFAQGLNNFVTGAMTVENMPDESAHLLMQYVNTLDEEEMRWALLAGMISTAYLRTQIGGCGGCAR